MPETIATPKPKNQGQRELAYDKLRRLPMLHGRIIGQEQWAEECRVSLDHHRQIVAALRQADGPTAKEILRRHLDEHPILPLHH